jgi:hypothetical protein
VFQDRYVNFDSVERQDNYNDSHFTAAQVQVLIRGSEVAIQFHCIAVQDNERYNRYNTTGSRFAGYFQSKNGNNYNGNNYQRNGENNPDFNNGFNIGEFARQQAEFRTNNGEI